MRATNTLTQTKEKRVTFSSAITGDSLQNLIRKSVASPDAAARFTGSLISAVASTPALQNCKPATVVAAALRGEGMGLTLGREYYLIPFADTCTFVIGYRGLISLCLAGNDVSDMDCIPVKEGEYIGRDKRTKRPKFDFSIYATDDEAEPHKTIGYYAYCEFANGRFRFEYMSVPEIIDHAARYSKAFNVEKYWQLQNGDLTPHEAEKLKQGSPWYGNFEMMCRKTVLRKLLNSGYVRLANSAAVRDAINYDSNLDGAVIPDLEIPPYTVVESTGEVIETAETAQDAPQPPESVSEPQEVSEPAEAPKRRQRAKKTPVVEVLADENEIDDDDAIASFFGEDEP